MFLFGAGYPTSLLPQSAEVVTPAGGEGTGHWFFHQFITDAYDNDQGGFIGLDDFIWGVPQVGLISSRSACCVQCFILKNNH